MTSQSGPKILVLYMAMFPIYITVLSYFPLERGIPNVQKYVYKKVHLKIHF